MEVADRCVFCGEQLDSDAVYCSYCGEGISKSQKYDDFDYAFHRKMIKLLAIVGVVGIIVCLSLFLFALIY